MSCDYFAQVYVNHPRDSRQQDRNEHQHAYAGDMQYDEATKLPRSSSSGEVSQEGDSGLILYVPAHGEAQVNERVKMRSVDAEEPRPRKARSCAGT